MDKRTREKIQEIIDKDYELAKKHKAVLGLKTDVELIFCKYVLIDLGAEYGFDIKGVE